MDTNKMRDISRDQFEATVIKQFEGLGEESPSLTRNDDGDYQGLEAQAAWWGWQASREAVVVELPPAPARPEEPEFALDDSHMDAYNAAVRMRDACAKAIEAQGLKVKP